MRNANWVDASITTEDAKNAETIVPYSEEYFNIANSNPTGMDQ